MGSITYLTADKVGYFHGSRRFYPSEDKTSYLRIMLLDEVMAGSFESGQGGSVQVDAVQLDFPAGAIMDANGNLYSGSVDVAMAAISPDDENLSDKMPGDLVGRALDGETGALASFGMTVVELQTPSGEPLQVNTGSKVQMSMDVPAGMIGGAPSTIPMWSFDEEAGIWLEEAVAELNGGQYVAEIPHFTWWNYDAWFPVAKFGASFVFESGTPVSQLSVCITAEGVGASKCSLTDEDGFICGLVPSGEVLLMEVKDECGNVIYSQNVGPLDDTVVIGPITLPETSVTLTNLSGEAVNCDGDPVTVGYVRARVGNARYYIELDDEGQFSATLMNCNASDILLNVVDEENLKQSLPQFYDYALNVNTGTITVCEEIEQMIIVEIPELDTTYTYLLADAFTNPGWTSITVQDSIGTTGNCSLFINGAGTGSYTGSINFNTTDGMGNYEYYYSQDSIDFIVTFFGDPGEYIQGTFSGEVSLESQQVETYPVNGSFTALRY